MRVNQFIFLGRICPIKSIEKLIFACSISKSFKREKFKLLIVGPVLNEFRAYFDSLIELITKVELENNILFLGNIDSPKKEILISQSKALLLVSQSENFGNVVLESLAQGTPVISSKGTPWQQLENHNCGYWIENSSEEIAMKMDEFIFMSKDRYNDMSANALLLSKEFSAAKIIPMWIEFVNGSTFRKKI
jgi:glycosyltransferase involved in cell wall biosynthesis